MSEKSARDKTSKHEMEIFVYEDLTDFQKERVRRIAAGDKVHFVDALSDGADPKVVFDRCEVAFGNPPAEWVATSTAIRWIQLGSVGFNEYFVVGRSLAERRVGISNLAGFFADPVAESCLAGILALYRGIDRFAMLKHQRVWTGDATRRRLKLLSRANAVLFGRGAINRRLAELLEPFDCKVTSFGADWTDNQLDGALETAEIVACAVPDTPRTRGVFSADRLAKLPPRAVIANFGRGSLIDEDALCSSLMDGRIAGAVIDVTAEEPLPARSRLWNCPNTLLTQHSGGGFAQEADRKIEVFKANLGRFKSGRTPFDIVDFEKGY